MADISTRAEDSSVTIKGDGCLDLFIAGDLRKRLADACESAENITVDLCSADFIDSAIESTLARACAILKQRGSRMRILVARGGQPARAVGLIGLAAIADIEEVPGR